MMDYWWITAWVLFHAGIGAGTCWYVDHRATLTEVFVTRVVVDAAQGFPEWRSYVREHPEELRCR